MGSFSRKSAIHGVLVNVWDTGVLIVGESGVGKSDCALELLSRGHKLIADDVVEIERTGDKLCGGAPGRFAGLLNVRDIGTVDVRDLYADAFEPRSGIDLCIELEDGANFDPSIEPNAGDTEILGVKIPKFTLPVDPGRNIPLLVETVVRLVRSGGLTAETALASVHDELVSNTAH